VLTRQLKAFVWIAVANAPKNQDGDSSETITGKSVTQLICSWYFCSWDSTTACVVDQQKFFLELGRRVRELRKDRDYSQEDMISFGFSARHWQQIEAGRPITVRTLLRICDVFQVRVERLVRGLDRNIYRH
jgi:DNA-binding XRE family transcriptional regulator